MKHDVTLASIYKPHLWFIILFHLASAVNVLLRNERNREHVEYSDFTVDTLSEIIALFTAPMTVTKD